MEDCDRFPSMSRSHQKRLRRKPCLRDERIWRPKFSRLPHLKSQGDATAKKLNSFELHLFGCRVSEGMIKKDDFRGYPRGDLIKVMSLEVHNLTD
jgi:hypothetical protein